MTPRAYAAFITAAVSALASTPRDPATILARWQKDHGPLSKGEIRTTTAAAAQHNSQTHHTHTHTPHPHP